MVLMKRSRTLPGVSRREIGLWSSTLYCDLLPFGISMMMACFQMFGMYPVARLWLHIVLYVWIMCGGRCLRWCAVMPEKPGALGFIFLKESVMCLVVICG